MTTETLAPKVNIIPTPWFTPRRREGRPTVFDRYFPGEYDRSDAQFKECKRAVTAFLHKVDTAALVYLAQQLEAGQHNEWTVTKDVAALLARHWNTPRTEVVETYTLVHLNDCTYWFAQAAGTSACPFIETTMGWIAEIIKQRS